MEEPNLGELEKEKIRLEKRGQKMQIIFLILTLLAIVALIIAIVTVHKYGQMLKNPLGYNLKQFGFDSCQCFKDYGRPVEIDAIGFTPISQNPYTILNISNGTG
jgi:hypothetical protein